MMGKNNQLDFNYNIIYINKYLVPLHAFFMLDMGILGQ